MSALHRHQLAFLSPAAWARIHTDDWDDQASECLLHWARQGLPLVVAQQGPTLFQASIKLGLPAPTRWGRRRLALSARPEELLFLDEFPWAHKALKLLPAAARAAWAELNRALAGQGLAARVYGSYGWQLLSGLDHVRKDSDIDLWLAVNGPAQADAAAACLQGFEANTLRLDGELVFPDGQACAWREWLAWRQCPQAQGKSLLLKSLSGPRLVQALALACPSEFLELA